jgi:hypothetical protein
MVRAVAQIEQELAVLDQTVVAIAQAFQETYRQYLTALGQATRQQLILASYHICTHSYPEQFIELPLEQRQELQDLLRELAKQAQAELLGCLYPVSVMQAERALLLADPNDLSLDVAPKINDQNSDSEASSEESSNQNLRVASDHNLGNSSDDNSEREKGNRPNLDRQIEENNASSNSDLASNSVNLANSTFNLTAADFILPSQANQEANQESGQGSGQSLDSELSLGDHAETENVEMPRDIFENPFPELQPDSEPEPILEPALEPSSVSDSKPRLKPQPLHPKDIAQWQSNLEDEIIEVLQTISHATNQVLQQTGILPDRLPEPILEVAAKADLSSETAASPPNLLNLLVEGDSEDEKPGLTQVVAMRLRLSEIEFGDSATAAQRSKLRHLTGQLAKLGREYQRKQKERAIAEAETAWRSSWHGAER